jgi:EAL domain-containing protein (putative c-di-GMP-specific phosphodiesterase class I)
MTHQAELADLKRMLGINLFLEMDEHALTNSVQQGLVCSFLGLNLSSAFQPVVKADGEIIGREALLRATDSVGIPLAPHAAFDHAAATYKLVAFDRLVRTIHLLNHANVFDAQELIFLNVHPQLLTSVRDHGRTFEQILHYYSVPTSQVVIEIQEAAVKDDVRLEEAVKNYRKLGYLIAIDNFGNSHRSLDKLFHPKPGYNKLGSIEGLQWLNRVMNLRPDFVKFDSNVIRQAETDAQALLVLHRLVNLLHGIGAKVAVQNIETAEQLAIARNTGADLFQGYQLGRPESVFDARGKLCGSELLAA